MASKKYKLNKEDGLKVWRGFLITLAGATIAYISAVYTAIDYSVPVLDKSVDLSPFVVPFIGALLEAARRWFAGHSQNG